MSANVKSIGEYLSKIKEIQPSENIFYRGHSDKSFQLIPSIYRKERLIENEHVIYRETISKVPYDFNGKSTIESLVLMQHYGVPTRILDLTTNALVALYFACVDDKNKDGEVVIFDIPQQDTCYFDSDRVTILANLAKCDDEFGYYTLFGRANLKKYEKELSMIEAYSYPNFENIDINVVRKEIKSIDEYFSDDFFLGKKKIEIDIDKMILEFHTHKNEDEKEAIKFLYIQEIKSKIHQIINKNKESNNKHYYGKLLHHIREDKSYFKSIINPDDVGSVFAVRPKLDNPRIVRQQGAFLIFGVEGYTNPYTAIKLISGVKKMPKIPEEWIKTKIGIEANSKEKILEELSKLGIDKSTLFPEIEKVAEYIKEKFQNQ
ncbi:FRG domain-containing protein [Capnocytophaga canimorsus]|uniref:FRG domain protein n=1 Tax=Capnocytophaga canimorsus (strain 5) TaxID=860228 RepID=F9YVJ6_CAPCC|nr:FRG domain-containing protein [Capnocytophaga canimorsus]AEK24430.1 FRG domain protein [Capnocytophaga canimorsus Cc5]GIM56326.1 hypothetical protein CAPN006_07200 [Capnocytophaga canimorsus]